MTRHPVAINSDFHTIVALYPDMTSGYTGCWSFYPEDRELCVWHKDKPIWTCRPTDLDEKALADLRELLDKY